MNSFLTQETSLQNWMMLAIGALLLLVIGGLIWAITSIIDIKRPKFGFGGKPLAVVTIGLITLLIPLSVFVVQQRVELNQKASELNEVSVIIYEVSDNQNTSDVSFSAVPIVNGKAWGEQMDDFTLDWTISGPETIHHLETGRNSNSPSYFILSLDKGSYTTTVIVNGPEFEVTQEKAFTIN